MTILILVVSLLAGMCVSEYYNRRIQAIMRESWQEVESVRRRGGWQNVINAQDYARMRAGERVVKRREGA